MDELWLIAAEGAEEVDPSELPRVFGLGLIATPALGPGVEEVDPPEHPGVSWLFEAPASGREASEDCSPEHPEFAETEGGLDAIK